MQSRLANLEKEFLENGKVALKKIWAFEDQNVWCYIDAYPCAELILNLA